MKEPADVAAGESEVEEDEDEEEVNCGGAPVADGSFR